MEIVTIKEQDVEQVAPLVAAFRVSLKKRIGIDSMPNEAEGRTEMQEYLSAKLPGFAAMEPNACVGYLVCRVDAPTVWVESLYVKDEFRRKGVATGLFHIAEKLAASYGEDTVFNFVHPNNHEMIELLRKNGYSVLNLIEIRKPYPGEVFSQKIRVGNYEFDY